ncbi:MAG: DUF1330 domain-containing protein [Stellaceae bacterium]
MTAYLIAEIDVTDLKAYEPYKTAASAAITRHGGKYVARGGKSRIGRIPGGDLSAQEGLGRQPALYRRGAVAGPVFRAAKAPPCRQGGVRTSVPPLLSSPNRT